MVVIEFELYNAIATFKNECNSKKWQCHDVAFSLSVIFDQDNFNWQRWVCFLILTKFRWDNVLILVGRCILNNTDERIYRWSTIMPCLWHLSSVYISASLPLGPLPHPWRFTFPRTCQSASRGRQSSTSLPVAVLTAQPSPTQYFCRLELIHGVLFFKPLLFL